MKTTAYRRPKQCTHDTISGNLGIIYTTTTPTGDVYSPKTFWHPQYSGTGTIWKWGAPVQSKSGGHRSRWKKKIFFFCCAPPLFGSKSTISRFGERFRGGQYSLVSSLFAVLLLTVPPCPAICKSRGGMCRPRAPRSRRHCPNIVPTAGVKSSYTYPDTVCAIFSYRRLLQ